MYIQYMYTYIFMYMRTNTHITKARTNELAKTQR